MCILLVYDTYFVHHVVQSISICPGNMDEMDGYSQLVKHKLEYKHGLDLPKCHIIGDVSCKSLAALLRAFLKLLLRYQFCWRLAFAALRLIVDFDGLQHGVLKKLMCDIARP
jgi:hypothetical protein